MTNEIHGNSLLDLEIQSHPQTRGQILSEAVTILFGKTDDSKLIYILVTLLTICTTTVVLLACRVFAVLKSIRSKPRSRSRSRHQSQHRRQPSHNSATENEGTTPTSVHAQDSHHGVAKNANGSAHLLIVLGSGGHTAEMISILDTLGYEYVVSRFGGMEGRRTWVVSQGDGISGERAREYEAGMESYLSRRRQQQQQESTQGQDERIEVSPDSNVDTQPSLGPGNYEIVVVPRARKIHQSLLTTPVSALSCLWACVQILRGGGGDASGKKTITTLTNSKPKTRYPDLMLLNGPGTAVMVVLASLILKVLGLAPIGVNSDSGRGLRGDNDHGLSQSSTQSDEIEGLMRTVYIESWARVKSLSLSGRLLRYLVGRFLVQWKGMEDVDLTVLDEKHRTGESRVQICRDEGSGGYGLAKARIEYVGTVVT